jgi:hypothetical protein
MNAINGTLKRIEDYRDQVPIQLDSIQSLLESDQEKWKKVIKLLAASKNGVPILAHVIAENPESDIAGIILKEW